MIMIQRSIQINYKMISLLAFFLISCGGGGGSSSSASNSTGNFINSPTKGIKYTASPSGLSGTTDADGSFSYRVGDTVTFSLDLGAQTLILGSTTNPSATTSVLSLAVPNGGDPIAVAQVLETLDKSSVDGKMDVSGISLNAGAALTAIATALTSSSVSSVNIQAIATAVQAALPAGITLKYGTVGVTQNNALSNLAKNPANQVLVEAKIKDMPNDGSTLVGIQDKPAFTSWIIKNNGQTEYQNMFGNILSVGGLTYSFKAPYTSNQDWQSSGTYTLNNGNKNGAWTGANSQGVGTFETKSSDSTSYVIRYTNTTSGETGSISGTFLFPLTLNDVKSKTFTIYGNCNGSNSTVTINSSGVSTDTCSGSSANGATWANGPYTNTLQYTETNGTRHYIGLTRLNLNGGQGNLPTDAVGTFVDISNENFKAQVRQTGFKVN
jgi:hypothetical protein